MMFVESKSGSTRQPVLPAVFKTVISYPRDARGGFDSHVLPPSITQKVPVMALQPHSYSVSEYWLKLVAAGFNIEFFNS
jgi:hypothetical protein